MGCQPGPCPAVQVHAIPFCCMCCLQHTVRLWSDGRRRGRNTFLGACLGVYSSGWLLLVLLVWSGLVGCGSYLGSAESQQRAPALIFGEVAVQYLCWPCVLHAERLQPLSYEGVGSE